jgi:hypothetical protein
VHGCARFRCDKCGRGFAKGADEMEKMFGGLRDWLQGKCIGVVIAEKGEPDRLISKRILRGAFENLRSAFEASQRNAITSSQGRRVGRAPVGS